MRQVERAKPQERLRDHDSADVADKFIQPDRTERRLMGAFVL
nr:hypothetical protein [Octadecabacter arcticus]